MVHYTLHHHPRSRDSDKDLILSLWYLFFPGAFQMIDGQWFIKAHSIVNVIPSPESIRRCRQKFQEMGLYPSTAPAVLARRKRADDVRSTINTSGWDEKLPK